MISRSNTFIALLFGGLIFLATSNLYAVPLKVDANEEAQSEIPIEDVQRFSNALGQIKRYYVKPVDDKELFDNAIRGMLHGLDPHSDYLDEHDFKELQAITTGEFGGLGLEVTIEDGVIRVVTPLVDSPAFKAGIKAGDYIIKIDNKPVQGLSLEEAVNSMRGKVNTPVVLTILRKGESKPLTFKIQRQNIQIKSVKSELLDNAYGYVRISQFQATTLVDMEKAINDLKKQLNKKPLQGLILDLRNNPGGLLDAAIQVSDDFIDNNKRDKEEIIVYTQGRLPGTDFTAVANPGDILNNAPMVVLINNGSASASEIVAGALKDNKRAIIVGTQSFGKGSVQTVLPLDETRAIKLTTALYYTPSGASIQAKGIKPDIVIEEIKVSDKPEPSIYEGISESSLKGHIKNENKNVIEQEISTKDELRLMRQDYQLYAALTILKGLAVAKR
jgi:carboxyl-terminal processing protease